MDANTTYVIGIDGGGTKTAAQLADLNGAVLTESQAGPSNFQVIGVDMAAQAILDVVHACCQNIGCSLSQIGSLTVGLTGAGRTADQQRMLEGLQRLAESRNVSLPRTTIESDARIALEGAFGGRDGIIVIAGTGSIVFGKDVRGNVVRAGGWGRLVGDEGSGYAIGKEAFRAVAKMIDGRGKKTSLARLIAAQTGLKTQEDIIRALYKENFDIASVTPLVTRAAQKKDRTAVGILDDAASELVEVIRAAAAQMNRTRGKGRAKLRLAFIGSLLSNDNIYSKKVRSLIRRRLPQITVQESLAPPAHGAVIMSIRSLKLIAANT